ncbi:hypothetical protein DFH08DRAFT_941003 [Mycena albidolilacea]|uniref:Uncharacterized protein n=1 Tax=Mycena albidolilacea TaxID=1033008 RepID=A0AAD6ZK95_9AGAR|nr:hypothetical protein DFH08DRAFT_941003 [Mycena albidolilacea]
MPAIAEQPISALTSMLPTKFLITFLVVAAVAMTIYYMLPLRLTDTLIALIAEAEEIYIEAHEMGLLSAAENEMLDVLQIQVSIVTEETLRNSLSFRTAFIDFCHGRAFILLFCIQKVQQFETHIKILKESQLRAETNSNLRAVLLRRRGVGSRYGGRQLRTWLQIE